MHRIRLWCGPVIPGANADLTACDREPITRLERIQSFGFLLAMIQDWTVVRASDNLESFIGVAAQAAIGKPVDSLLNRQALHDIRNRMLALILTRGTERLYGLELREGLGPFDVAVHQSGPYYILEAEPSGATEQTDATSMVRGAISRLQGRASWEGFHRDAARQVRAMSGFDRVLIYQFDDEGAGEVIAESVTSGMQSYLGLHYPASDIPQQARALYVRNPFRIIADVNANTVPILTSGEESPEPLDLTLSVTRAVSPVHIEYLRNMGVAASMSISIIVNGALWGLIACHQRASRRPNFMLRTAAEFFGQVYSLTLESRLRKNADEADERVRQATHDLVQAVVGDDGLLLRAEWLQSVMQDIIECDGTVVVSRGLTFSSGDVPTAPHLDTIVRALNAMPRNRIVASAYLADLVPDIEDDSARPAGMCAIPLSSTQRDYLLLFRNELVTDIRWAGEPVKTHVDSNEALSPRKSFDCFLQTVKGRSRPFTPREMRAAESIRVALIEVVLRVAEDADDARQRLTERQETLIAELNHRMRNIFVLIRGLVNQSRNDAYNAEQYAKALDGRILALSRAHDRVTRKQLQPAPLHSIFDEEINAYVPESRDRFSVSGSKVLLKPQAFGALALVIHELVTNCSKYGALSANGRVDVLIVHDGTEGVQVHWRESDGPPVKQPTRRGFGSVVLERVIPYDLKGTAEIKYIPGGLEAKFVIPADHLAGLETAVGHSAGPSPTPAVTHIERPLEGLSVLLVEDNLIAALEAEDLLKDCGAGFVWTVPNIPGARQVLADRQLEFAMLDVNVGAENSFSIAAELHDRGIPFLYASGYDERLPQLDGVAKIGSIVKPYDRAQLCAEVSRVMISFRDIRVSAANKAALNLEKPGSPDSTR